MEQYFRSVISGEKTGVLAAMLRGLARMIEPIYRTIVESRNSSYSRGARPIARAGKPVISVGNITTGGTGKTPVVAWLARQLRARNQNVAILLRGYKSSNSGSDEQQMLRGVLNPDPSDPAIIVQANPDRIAGASAVLQEHPRIDLFILDDAFQHRRIHRDFDLVLIDATNPFGYDHVLPRGLLREPLHSLSRANALLLTRVDQALPGELPEIERCLREHAAHVPVYRCNHAHRRLIGADGSDAPMSDLTNRKILAFGGIGNPAAFERQLRDAAAVVATRWFGDHHHYDQRDLTALRSLAQQSGAAAMVTTEKDWVKLAPLAQQASAAAIPILRVQMEIEFAPGDEKKLLDQILSALAG